MPLTIYIVLDAECVGLNPWTVCRAPRQPWQGRMEMQHTGLTLGEVKRAFYMEGWRVRNGYTLCPWCAGVKK
jgi:hypothetical protein